MAKKDFNTEFDGLLREALKTTDKPDVRLDNGLKAELYERERLLRQGGQEYLPLVPAYGIESHPVSFAWNGSCPADRQSVSFGAGCCSLCLHGDRRSGDHRSRNKKNGPKRGNLSPYKKGGTEI